MTRYYVLLALAIAAIGAGYLYGLSRYNAGVEATKLKYEQAQAEFVERQKRDVANVKQDYKVIYRTVQAAPSGGCVGPAVGTALNQLRQRTGDR